MKDFSSIVESKELEVPSTTFTHDIEPKVVQVIILNTLSHIEGVSLIGGNLIDTLFGREVEKVKGIFVDQDQKNHQLKVKVDVNMHYGVSIPRKSDEIQQKLVQEITKMTGLHVASVHVIVKGLVLPERPKNSDTLLPAALLVSDEEYQEESV
jgi:uncharacterized alkaline shock family protein YloU